MKSVTMTAPTDEPETWQKPPYNNKRFGFEVTMYAANTPNLARTSLKALNFPASIRVLRSRLTQLVQRTSTALALVALAAIPLPTHAAAPAAELEANINVRLNPVVTQYRERDGSLHGMSVVTDINVVDEDFYICTQNGLLLRKRPRESVATIFKDLRPLVGTLGSRIPGLAGLGYPNPGTYDERGLLGFVADPNFSRNGRFWVWYSNINEFFTFPLIPPFTPPPGHGLPTDPFAPYFFQWLISTSDTWDQNLYDHVDHLEEYKSPIVNGVPGVPVFQRTILKVKRPFFNHTGFQSLVWSPEHHTLLLGLGDGGSEYDPYNLSQNDDQLSGKLLKIDLNELKGVDFSSSVFPPVATFSDLEAPPWNVPRNAFTALIKGMRNPSKVHFEKTEHTKDGKSNFIKYLANTGQDTLEFIHGFENYGLNFGFRPWEGIFPTSFETDCDSLRAAPIGNGTLPLDFVGFGECRVIAYSVEASNSLPNFYRPLVSYNHNDAVLGPNANTGSALYRGTRIPGLKGQLVFSDWFSSSPFIHPLQGLLLHASVDRCNLQQAQQVKRLNVRLPAPLYTAPPPPNCGTASNTLPSCAGYFYTSINTDPDGKRIFVGVYGSVEFINNPVFYSTDYEHNGGLYEILPN